MYRTIIRPTIHRKCTVTIPPMGTGIGIVEKRYQAQNIEVAKFPQYLKKLLIANLGYQK